MTEYIDKDELLKSIKTRIGFLETNTAEHVSRKEFRKAATNQDWMIPLNTLVDEIEKGIFSVPNPEPAWKPTKDLIAELRTRAGVQVKEFLDIREGDTWSISGEFPSIVITVADFWRDRS